MIDFTTPNGSIRVKSSYYDLTCSECARILERPKDFVFVFSVLTGLPEEELPAYDLESVVEFVSFLNESARDLEPLDFVTVEGVDHFGVDVFECSWAKKITADELIRVIKPKDETEKEKYIVIDLVELVAIYTTEQTECFDESKIERTRELLDQMSVAEVYPFGLFLQKQLADIHEMEGKLLKTKYTSEQIQAGIHEFNKLGVFNTIDMIAQGDPLKYDAVKNLPFSSVFNKLVLSNISSKFEKRLSDILRDKAKPIGK